MIGKYYRQPKKSGPFPLLDAVGSYMNSLRKDHFVSDNGDVVYYQTDPRLAGSNPEKKVDEPKSC